MVLVRETKEKIVVIGGGIIGLATATELAKLDKRYHIVLISEKLPSDYDEQLLAQDGYLYDYTSLWAGAHYRPFPYKSDIDGKLEQLLNRITYSKLLKEYNDDCEYVKFMKGYDFVEAASPEYKNFLNGYNSANLHDFKPIQNNRFNFFGAEYMTWCINSPKFMKYLLQLLQTNPNFEIVHKEIESLKQVFDEHSDCAGIFDCSGTGVKYDENSPADENCYLIRGQTMLLQSNILKDTSYYNKTITYQSVNKDDPKETDWTFIIPRPPLNDGVFIIGGTKQLDKNGLISPTKEDQSDLLKRAKRFFPELFDSEGTPKFRICKNVVGFRPARKNGFRLDKRWVDYNGLKFIISSYGAGGMGYELSFGAATKAVQLLEEGVKSKL